MKLTVKNNQVIGTTRDGLERVMVDDVAEVLENDSATVETATASYHIERCGNNVRVWWGCSTMPSDHVELIYNSSCNGSETVARETFARIVAEYRDEA
jgi:hypothetical protein